MARTSPRPPFTWLVVHVVSDWPHVGPPPDLAAAHPRAMVELDGPKGGEPIVLQQGQRPEKVHRVERTATVVELFGAHRSDAYISPMHRDEYLSWTLGSCGWRTHRFGVVHAEIARATAHTKMALRPRLLADLMLLDAWVRQGERTPCQIVDL